MNTSIIEGLTDVEEDLDVAASATCDAEVNLERLRGVLVRITLRVRELRMDASVQTRALANDRAMDGAA